MVSFFKMWQLLFVAAAACLTSAADLPPSCSRPVYCNSSLLHFVQMARVYADSKSFVDLEMKYDQNQTLADFDKLLEETDQNPTVDQLKEFVDKYFMDESVLEDWIPSDFSTDPDFANTITDPKLKQFAKDINAIWLILSKKMKPEIFEKPEQFSLIPVSHGFIVPGGRFKEIYYWDTYWIIEGLLISGMNETARGMIENLIELLNKIGHIPNGSRWYYQERSQPPLLSGMMALYYEYTKDEQFIRNNIRSLEKEVNYWLDKHLITVEKDDKEYNLLRYYAPSAGPRPESYREDYEAAAKLDENKQEDFYTDIKSAAESGWDFSSRWFVTDNGSYSNLIGDIHTSYFVPVDLNAIFTGVLQNVANFHTILRNCRKSARYNQLANQWRSAIQAVLWDEDDGVWYDYDIKNKVHRKIFYTSNFAPLWQGAVPEELILKNGPRVIKYLEDSKSLAFIGGLPTSLNQSGEQWDFPNVWPPEVSIVVNALDAIGTVEAVELAFEIATRFVRSCHIGYTKNKQMFEKYDAAVPGQYGGGGEYNVQFGFGWSNGAVLEFLLKYGKVMTADDSLLLREFIANATDAAV